ncbi:hypothetical protein QO209_31085 [Pseudomonas citronellolis]|uniref:hypothetical protein n=1 Tax=Pseudomonas citronellolis TaxID=53408 RepID=UPI0026482E5A|nr:hypothetical protein [Pseudomonas citronellolis]MDN6876911.1 hypothetical protein [Pseudomonas citronellolis]
MSELKPAAIVRSRYGDPEAFGERWLEVLADIQSMPYGAKLYAIPADQMLVKRESLSIILDYIKGDCGHSQEDIFHAALSLQISLRAKA